MYPKTLSLKTHRRRRQLPGFTGLDRTAKAAPGALSDSRGVGFDAYPCLSTRRGRASARKTRGAGSIFAWGELCAVEGTTLYYGDQAVGTVTPGKKQFAVVNTKLCIFPDKKYLDLTTREFGDLGALVVNRHALEAVFTENSLSLEPDTLLGETAFFKRNVRPDPNRTEHRTEKGIYYYLKVYDHVAWDEDTGTWTKEGEKEIWMMDDVIRQQVGKYVILAEPTFEGGKYLNTKEVRETRTVNGGPGIVDTLEVLEDYQEDSKSGLYGVITDVKRERSDYLYYNESYVVDVTLTVELHNAGAGNRDFAGRFFPGDRVYVSGCARAENNTPEGFPLTVESVSGHTMTFRLPEGATAVFTPGTDTGLVTVERRVPDLDFICEGDNRLFGVSNAQGRVYASALGDPRNFDAWDGLSTDSWRQSVGTAGDFTGCVAFGGSVLFWKEDCLHKLMGARPSAYQLYTCHTDGLQSGSEGSMVILNDVLYYKGRNGVYAYSGSTPKLISAPLGNVAYDTAAAGASGLVYRVSMRRQDTGKWELFSYHTGEGVWLKEDELRASGFARVKGTLYLLSGDTVYALDQGGDDAGTPIPWEAALAPTTENVPERKYPSRLLLRLELEPGAWVEAGISRDGRPFERLWTGHDCHAPTAVIPIRPGRCDRFQVRLRGEGRCVVRDLAWEFTLGGVE